MRLDQSVESSHCMEEAANEHMCMQDIMVICCTCCGGCDSQLVSCAAM